MNRRILYPKVCPCGQAFTTSDVDAIYHSTSCRAKVCNSIEAAHAARRESSIPARVERFVKDNPLALFDKHSVAHGVGCHPKHAERALDTVHCSGMLIIDHWIRGPGRPRPCYRTTHRGDAPDAPRPDPLPPSVKSSGRRTRPEVREVEAMKKRHNRNTPRLGMFGL